jgi:hypothetical protein
MNFFNGRNDFPFYFVGGKKSMKKIRSRVSSQNYSMWRKQEVCHTVTLPFTLKSILRQKMNYGNSNISPCKNVIFKEIL